MDPIDLQIIELLKKNSRTAVSEIGKRVNLSVPAVSARIRKMEDAGIIAQYTVRIRPAKIGLNLTAFILVNLDDPERIDFFRKTILQYDPVVECHHLAGNYDYLLKVIVADTPALEDFITNALKRIKGVVRTNTFIALSSLKENSL